MESAAATGRSSPQTPDPEDWKKDVSPAWQALRKHPVASSISLVLPRFLLRLPYGKKTDACEQFAFEEIGEDHDHESYLWGNAAFLCAALLAESFSSEGWGLRAGRYLNVSGLPLHVYDSGGESKVQPCAEILMTEKAAGRILGRGLMPLATLKDTDEVRLVRFQSIADPPAALAGRWG